MKYNIEETLAIIDDLERDIEKRKEKLKQPGTHNRQKKINSLDCIIKILPHYRKLTDKEVELDLISLICEIRTSLKLPEVLY